MVERVIPKTPEETPALDLEIIVLLDSPLMLRTIVNNQTFLLVPEKSRLALAAIAFASLHKNELNMSNSRVIRAPGMLLLLPIAARAIAAWLFACARAERDEENKIVFRKADKSWISALPDLWARNHVA